MTKTQLKNIIRNIPDFPIKGIQFKDITPLLTNAAAFQSTINIFCDFIKKLNATAILAPEARGFIFGSAIAYQLGLKFVPARKKGKLPFKTYTINYDLEYNTTTLQIHQDALTLEDKVVIVDDLIATAGTINACINLINQSSAQVVGIATLISLSEFSDSHHFNNIPLLAIITF